ncbi:hypothetical protein [Roseobacter sp. MH60115]|uniref:hypothetical protein n=1 Tax=Roseobacter sp. MH60115 TaxID=2785324 RepID=UPI0018A250A3|nr:hypothetical protein [Roseobacter sp. MH60115]
MKIHQWRDGVWIFERIENHRPANSDIEIGRVQIVRRLKEQVAWLATDQPGMPVVFQEIIALPVLFHIAMENSVRLALVLVVGVDVPLDTEFLDFIHGVSPAGG